MNAIGTEMDMMLSTWLLLSIVSLAQVLPAVYSNCPVKQCSCVDYELYCYSKGLTSVPRFTAVNTTASTYSIDLRKNDIRRIEAFAFSSLSLDQDVEVRINLDDVSVEYMDDAAFGGLGNNIIQINMNSTKLPSLPKAFTVLKKLRVLVINAPLKPSVMMEIGPSLRQLHLVGVRRWPSGLQYAIQLLELEVHVTINTEPEGENTTRIPSDAFTGFAHSLETLSLNGPAVTQSPNPICRLQNLSSLTLRDCDLASCISAIPSCYQPMTSVRRLHVSSVRLDSAANISVVFPALTDLLLNYNNLDNLPDDLYLPNITTIDLSDNKFTRIPSVITRFPYLASLWMHNNSITSLEANSFGILLYLTGLYLGHNPISSIADQTFRYTLRLTFLVLENTKLTTIPKAIRYLRRLYLDMNNTPLKCSCDLAWFLLWEQFNLGEINSGSMCQPGNETLSHFIKTKLIKCDEQLIG